MDIVERLREAARQLRGPFNPHHVELHQLFTPAELEALAKLAEAAEWYGEVYDFYQNYPMHHCETYDELATLYRGAAQLKGILAAAETKLEKQACNFAEPEAHEAPRKG